MQGLTLAQQLGRVMAANGIGGGAPNAFGMLA
jgi:hypothetical protein